jgi:CubicO group peptidase (beta-lactamase class C family)
LVSIGELSAFEKTYLPDYPNRRDDLREKFGKIDEYLKRVSKEGFSGAVLVEKDGRVFEKCYGFSDRENKIECDTETVFDIGSVTKQFTAAAILKLEMQGQLSVTDKLRKFFENVPAEKQNITIHQLLTHSAGFSDAVGRDYEAVDKTAFLKKAFAAELQSKPGEKFDYSNVGYSVLAAIIEKVTGQSYEKYLYDNLFAPAKMFKTGYTLPNWKDEQIAVGYTEKERWGKPTKKNWDKTAPFWNLLGNGGILSTTGDLYRWHQALIGEKILNKRAKEKFYKRHIKQEILVGANDEGFYGYGWALVPTRQKTFLITHSGGNGVFFADFWRILQEDETIILLANRIRPELENIPSEIHRILTVEVKSSETDLFFGWLNAF